MREAAEWNELLRCAHAWYFNPDEIPADTLRTRCLPWLSVDEREHYRKLRTPQLRHEYLAAHALVRQALSCYAPVEPGQWRFSSGAHGKTSILGPPSYASLRFNLTHTRGLAVCAVSRAGPVGVDAEETSRAVDVDAVASIVFSDRERSHLATLAPEDRPRRFFELWVLKEALLKAIGKDVTDAGDFSIEFAGDGMPHEQGGWQFTLRRLEGAHVAALVVRAPKTGVQVSVIWLNAGCLFEAGVAVEGGGIPEGGIP
jgi:4'-phosphopantetheinyl transferase